MLLVHQAGSLKIGQAVRYTLTYTPSNDRILPTPSHLHLRIKNTSTIALRAAWVHGPYALHVSCYPSTFNPHEKVDDPDRHGVPEYEPMLKAGGSWLAKLTVPEDIRETGADLGKTRGRQSFDSTGKDKKSVTWIIEVASQILFSTSASVNYEILVGRDERSLDFGFAAIASQGHGAPGQIEQQKQQKHARSNSNAQAAGVYSKAVKLIAEDVETLWNKPELPQWDDSKSGKAQTSDGVKGTDRAKPTVRSSHQEKREQKKKNIHLVILTHGLHSNLGADMLFMKESIDATVRQARIDAKARRDKQRGRRKGTAPSTGESSTTKDGSAEDEKHADGDPATAPVSGGQEDLDSENENGPDVDDEEDEETVVRGFPGNAAKTENGIQYLGKRLAKYILRLTYPDQPFLPVKKKFSRQLTDTFKSDSDKAARDGPPSHPGSSVHDETSVDKESRPYRFTSISFIGHSLGGLVQTYAIAYIHKHSPTFFQQIEPVNFICMASPMLGLSNENPMYVKFALDFGLVGRTGQDLGLTWRPPTLAKGGWNAVMGGLGIGNKDKDKDDQGRPVDPAAKPLLRILPSGPAHQVLRMFRNRTVYSNVVNDGIVPLRTSCLLFLDWRGLGKVNKARRENGLISTVAEWGWAELTGANSSSITPNIIAERYEDSADSDHDDSMDRDQGETVPQPSENETSHDNGIPRHRYSYEGSQANIASRGSSERGSADSTKGQDKGLLGSMMDFFRPKPSDDVQNRPHQPSKKTAKAIRRAQTIHHDESDSEDTQTNEDNGSTSGITSNPTMRPHLRSLDSHNRSRKRPTATRGDSMTDSESQVSAPPKTSIFESAGDILHPPLPSRQWITDPSSRSRTIFHDRVYHPEDIPPPPVKQPSSRMSRNSTKSGTSTDSPPGSRESIDTSGMKVEEKIARAYHRDMSWRKVLVRLEPDAHNNMIVRRMFANAYGWPVVKHLCDTHFADTYTARTRDEDEPAQERAPNMSKPVPPTGEEVANQTAKQPPPRSSSEMREARDELTDLDVSMDGASAGRSSQMRPVSRQGSDIWDDSIFEGSDNDDSDVDERNIVARFLNPHHPATATSKQPATPERSAAAVVSSSSFTDGHRGLAPSSPSSPRSPTTAKRFSSQHVSPSFDIADLDRPVIAKTLVTEPQPLDSDAKQTSNAKS